MKNAGIILVLASLICIHVNLSIAGYDPLHSVFMTARVEVTSNIVPPAVSVPIHTPLDRINIVNDQIILNVTLSTQTGYTNCVLHYRVKGGPTNYSTTNFAPLISTFTTNTYHGEAVIPAAKVTEAGIEYYITAMMLSNTWSFRSNHSPQVIPFVEKENMVYTRNGKHTITLMDGNAYDGITTLSIKNYTENVNVVFKQLIHKDSDYPKNNFHNVQSASPAMLFEIQPLGGVLPDSAELNLLYLDVDKNGQEDTLGVNEQLLKIFWFDGFDWRYVGGDVDAEANIIRSSIYRFGTFGIFPVSGVDYSAFKPEEKIITPNGDGINDNLLFSGLTGTFEIKIVDMTGRLIRVVTDVPYWDGKDTQGNYAHAGAYLYMLKQNGKILKGTFVIAR